MQTSESFCTFGKLQLGDSEQRATRHRCTFKVACGVHGPYNDAVLETWSESPLLHPTTPSTSDGLGNYHRLFGRGKSPNRLVPSMCTRGKGQDGGLLESVELATLKSFEEPLLMDFNAHERERKEAIYKIGRTRELRGGLALDERSGSVRDRLETVKGHCA